MRFLLIFAKKSVPEWKQCYYDYANIKSIIILCKKSYAIRCNISDLARHDNYSSDEKAQILQKGNQLKQIRDQKIQKIDELMNEANLLFYEYHSLNKRVVFLFCQMKIHQLTARLDKYKEWEPEIVQNRGNLTALLSNCYAENIKLQTMTQLHLEAYKKITQKHRKAFKSFNLTTPSLNSARLARTFSSLQQYSNSIQQVLKVNEYQEIIPKQTKFQLEQQIQPSPLKISIMSYLFGLCNGFSISVLIAAIILLGVNIGDEQTDDSDRQQKRRMFVNQFRLWKGVGFIILYVWVFAVSFYIFQRRRINYNLIFDYPSKTQKSTSRLGVATFYTLLWCCFFIFYVMDLIDIYPVQTVTSSSIPITIYFPIIIFGLFVLSIIMEFLRTQRGVIFFAFTLAKVLLTPLGLFRITFGVIWATQQFVSLVQVIFDISYSICYYSRTITTPSINPDPCLDLIIIAQILLIVFYGIRWFQLIRIGIQNRKFIGTREMYRWIRASLHITLASLSLGSSTQKWAILWVWVALAFITAIYAYAIDLLLDFNLYMIENDGEGVKLEPRGQNIFSLRSIRIMMAIDLVCRFSFIITFCPKILFTYVPHPEIIITVAGILQLVRRLIWNLLRVENQQIKNNYHFQIRTDYDDKQKKIQKQLQAKGVKAHIQGRLEGVRTSEQVHNLRKFIRDKNKMKQKVVEFQERVDKLVEMLEDEAEGQIGAILQSKKTE